VLDLDYSAIKGGSPDDPSTAGVFRVYGREREHSSSKYPDPPGNMNLSLFYNDMQALHQGPVMKQSHGCIHVRGGEAERLFDWAGSNNVMVIVVMKDSEKRGRK
jgi:hypothetical protein